LFDLSFFKIAVLAIIALVVFGPDQLPRMAVQAGRLLRDIRRYADGARADLQQHLPDEFKEFDLNELNPKYFVRKHLMDDVMGGGSAASNASAVTAVAGGPLAGGPVGAAAPAGTATASAADGLAPGEKPPWDDEAT
jgi:sec-independent protein translocase protein TatB